VWLAPWRPGSDPPAVFVSITKDQSHFRQTYCRQATQPLPWAGKLCKWPRQTGCVAWGLVEQRWERELAPAVLQCLGVGLLTYGLSRSVSCEGSCTLQTPGWALHGGSGQSERGFPVGLLFSKACCVPQSSATCTSLSLFAWFTEGWPRA